MIGLLLLKIGASIVLAGSSVVLSAMLLPDPWGERIGVPAIAVSVVGALTMVASVITAIWT